MGFVKACIKKVLFRILPESAVIMFHHVNEKSTILNSKCILDFNRFCKVIDSFNCYEALEYVLDNPNKKKIAITFDDGLEDVYTFAYPFLKKKNIPFTIFVVTDFLGKPGYITENQLKEMASDQLVTVGSHGITHEIFSKMDNQEKEIEIKESQQILKKITGQKVNIFAYSHGIIGTNTYKLMSAYKYGMAVQAKPINILTVRKKYALPRYNIENCTADKAIAELKYLMRV